MGLALRTGSSATRWSSDETGETVAMLLISHNCRIRQNRPVALASAGADLCHGRHLLLAEEPHTPAKGVLHAALLLGCLDAGTRGAVRLLVALGS